MIITMDFAIRRVLQKNVSHREEICFHNERIHNESFSLCSDQRRGSTSSKSITQKDSHVRALTSLTNSLHKGMNVQMSGFESTCACSCLYDNYASLCMCVRAGILDDALYRADF